MQKAIILLFLAGCTASCHSQPKPNASSASLPSDACPIVGRSLRTVTINAGLAPGVVGLSTPRIAPFAEESARSMRDADVMCFQEVWTKEAKDAVISALGPDIHTYYIETRGENERAGIDACTFPEIEGVADCGTDACGDLPDEEQTICAREKCHGELVSMYMGRAYECLNCVAAMVGHSVDEIVGRCLQPDNGSTVQGVSRAYDGQNGIILASRYPLSHPEAIRLRASFSNRVALLATIEPDGFGPIEIACTHVSTWNELPPNQPEFADWNEEMIGQIETVSARLAERAEGRSARILRLLV